MRNRESCPKSCNAYKQKEECFLVKMTKAVVRNVPPLEKQTLISADPLDNSKSTYEAEAAHKIITEIHVIAKELGCTKITEKINPNYPGRNRL